MSNFCYLDNADDEFNYDIENLKIKTDYDFDYKSKNNRCIDKNYRRDFDKNTSKNTCFIEENDNIKKDKHIFKDKKEKKKVRFSNNNNCIDRNYEEDFDKNTSKNTCFVVNNNKISNVNNKPKNKISKKTIQHHDKNCFDYGLTKFRDTPKNSCFINDKDNDTSLEKIDVCDEKKKVKYFDSINRNIDLCPDKSNINGPHRIDDESFLLLPRMNSKQKAKVELKDTMHPNDYSIDLKYDTINKTKTYTSYYGDHYGPGKGFGNSIVSNEIRTGLSSRDDIEKFNQTIESKIDGPRDILFKNYQNPNNLILPFPRGGENTRKSVQSNNKNLSTEFNFKY